jgi:hypothetical protein
MPPAPASPPVDDVPDDIVVTELTASLPHPPKTAAATMTATPKPKAEIVLLMNDINTMLAHGSNK